MKHFVCPECGNNEHREIFSNEQHEQNGKSITIHNIPTLECTACGAHSYSFAALEYVEQQKTSQSSIRTV
ncbi:YgiT-type zinc finger protein [Paenibacillus medicaginis]|uniref:YgiT-type zinc finger protein n=1 Tax=Paenibacillus medicaginis TaxID=1470560 RepID=A0ABV5BUW0_9BACL